MLLRRGKAVHMRHEMARCYRYGKSRESLLARMKKIVARLGAFSE